jgi:hypothetical protein
MDLHVNFSHPTFVYTWAAVWLYFRFPLCLRMVEEPDHACRLPSPARPRLSSANIQQLDGALPGAMRARASGRRAMAISL